MSSRFEGNQQALRHPVDQEDICDWGWEPVLTHFGCCSRVVSRSISTVPPDWQTETALIVPNRVLVRWLNYSLPIDVHDWNRRLITVERSGFVCSPPVSVSDCGPHLAITRPT
jgi:hypothetical protein